jgi:hypothetical protein
VQYIMQIAINPEFLRKNNLSAAAAMRQAAIKP